MTPEKIFYNPPKAECLSLEGCGMLCQSPGGIENIGFEPWN